jgi:hypothetical protein
MRPVQVAVPEVRHTPLAFATFEPLKIRSEQPELVTGGIASGLKEGVGGALQGITAAFVGEREKKEALAKEQREHDRAIALAKIRSQDTTDEDYKKTRLKILQNQLEKQKEEGKSNEEEITYGDIDEQDSTKSTLTPVEEDLPKNEIWDLGLPPETEEVFNPLFSSVPTQQEVQNVLNRPLSELTVNAENKATELENMLAGNLTPVGQTMSTDIQAPEKPASFNILSKNKSLVSPEEARKLQEEFYSATGELPTGFGALSILPKPEAQQVPTEQKAEEVDLNRYFKTWADVNVARKAVKEISKIFGPEYNEAKIEQIKTKKGETGFKVIFPERKTDKELAEEKKGTGVDFDTERKLRDEYIGQTKDFKTIQSAWRSIKTSGKEPSAAGDMSLIFGYMKLLDPASTVREGEYANAQNAAGIPDRIRATFNKAIDGQILSETQRKDFLNQAKKQYESRLGEYNQLKDSYSGLAKQYGLEPKRIIVDFNILEEVPESENLANLTKQKFMQMKEMPEGEEKEQLKKELKVLVEQLRATQKK